MLEKVESCPECNSELKAGWIGERGRIRWYDKQRKIITVFNQGESLLKHEFWRGRFGEREAKNRTRIFYPTDGRSVFGI